MNDSNDSKIQLSKGGWKKYGDRRTTVHKTELRSVCNHCKADDKHEFIAENKVTISFRCCKCGMVNIIIKYM